MEPESPEIRNWRVETTKALGMCRTFKFTGKYWTQWKECVISSLQSVRLEHLLWNNFQLAEDATQEDQAEYHAAQTCVRNYLYMYMSTEYISDLNGVTDVFGIWKKLRDTFENRGIRQWTHIFDNWFNHTQGASSMEQYIREEEEFAERLKSLGKTFGEDQDGLKTHFFMKGLHSRYEMHAELYSLMEKPYDDIIAHFRSVSLQKESKRGASKPEAHASTSAGGRKKGGAGTGAKLKPKTCYKCAVPGHHSSTCTVEVPTDAEGKPIPICFFCKERGHVVSTCPRKGKEGANAYDK
jgi:hypothetical protein